MELKKLYNDAIFGVAVGDALGLPVQFAPRSERKADPVREMRGHGVFDMPEGSWSDDTSMTLAALDAINNYGMNYTAIMHNFVRWLEHGEFTPSGRAYDIGRTCMASVENFEKSGDWKTCGLRTENDNGNGSLMRIMPFVLYGVEQSAHGETDRKIIEMIHNGSALTHAHNRAKIACGIYYFLSMAIIDYVIGAGAQKTNGMLRKCLQSGIVKAFTFYAQDTVLYRELKEHYGRLYDIKAFASLPEKDIKSTGYCVDTLEAAVWCLANTNNYKGCELKAVNLGLDTDTVGAVAGGLAGLFYGKEGIPEEWLNVLARKRYIEKLCAR